MTRSACAHCFLPIRGAGDRARVNGEWQDFCCYGCRLAFQVHSGQGEEAEAAGLLIRLGVSAFLAMNIMLFSIVLYSGSITGPDAYLVPAVHGLLWVLATAVMIVLGTPFLVNTWRAARKGRVSTDALVSLGALTAYAYSSWQVATGGEAVYFDTATMVLVLFTVGRYLEALGRARASRSLGPLLEAERATATVVTERGESEVPVREVSPGSIVRVRPGARLPVDGVVLEGQSQCEESLLTGQPAPRPKQPGAAVHAGSINGNGHLLVRATAAGTASRWASMSRTIREALARKSVTAEAVDRAVSFFIPAVLALAAGAAVHWASVGTAADALTAALAVLVVACPCALGLAAPLATALGLGQAAEQGILVRSGGALERLARIDCIAFDKTGTLSTGELALRRVTVDGAREDEILATAGALAVGSEHPVARSILSAARANGLPLPEASGIEAVPGEGMVGIVRGERVAVGSRSFMARLEVPIPPSLQALRDGPGDCGTRVYVAWGGRAQGLLLLADTPLAEAREVVVAARELGLATILLTGDSSAAAARMASELGIDTWRGDLTPEGKVNALRSWSGRGARVAMVGDGLNDGPILAAASVGVAVGGATDYARETADVTLPVGALSSLPWAIGLARRVRRTVLTNIAWAFGYNTVVLGIAAAGLLQPLLAAVLMAGSSVLVIANSLRVRGEAREGHSAMKGASLTGSALILASILLSAPEPGIADEPARVETLIETMIWDESPGARRKAVQELGELEVATDEVVSALSDALEADADLGVRWHAAAALEALEPLTEPAVRALARALAEDWKAGVRARAAQALGTVEADSDTIVPALLEALREDPDPGVRARAAWALGTVNPRTDRIAAALRDAEQGDRHHVVRTRAAEALLEQPL